MFNDLLDSFLFHLTIELLLGFFALLISVRIIGKRQIQQITPFDFVSAIVLGEILGNALFDMDANLLYLIYAIVVWTLLSVFIEFLNMKSLKIRRVIEGVPTVIIKNGQIQYDVMKKEKIDFNELLSLLREKDVFAIREVKYAFIETSGAITVMKKAYAQPPTIQDLDIKNKEAALNLPVIMDGEVVEEHLQTFNLNKKWLLKKLKDNKIDQISDVLYAEWNQSEDFYFQKFSSK